MTDVKRLPVLASLQHVYFQFANGETLLEDLNLSFDSTPTGIVGRNGAGKSVLAQLIAGRLAPSSGTLEICTRLAYVPQALGPFPEQTVAQITGTADVLGALDRLARGEAHIDDLERIDDRWDLAERLRKALDAAGLPEVGFEDHADQLSGGQLARLAVIGALLANPQLLILDEPTNHLDSQGREWLLSILDDWRGGLIVVSHDRQLLNRMQRIVELSPLDRKSVV